MLIRTIFTSAFVLFFLSVNFAQTQQVIERLTSFQDSIIMALANISFNKSSRVKEHNLYLDKGWQNSAVVTADDQILYFSGRFNVLNNAIEMKLKDKIKFVYPRKIKLALIGQDLLIPAKGNQFEKATANTYLHVLSYGKINLFNRYVLESKIEGGNSLVPEVTGQKKYYIDESYYYSEGFGSFSKLRSSKKKVLALFKDKSEEVSSFVKANKLKFNNKEDLTKIFDYYNKL